MKRKIKRCLSKEWNKTGKNRETEFTVLGGTPFTGNRTYSGVVTEYEFTCNKCSTVKWSDNGNLTCLEPTQGGE